MYFSTVPYRDVLMQLQAVLLMPDFFVRLTGPDGSGKTALLEQFRQHLLEEDYRVTVFSGCPATPVKFRRMIAGEFHLGEVRNFSRRFQDHLIEESGHCKGVVLLFDNCELLSDDVLTELHRLTHLQIDGSRMLSVVMCGSEVLHRRIENSAGLVSLRQRITLRLQLDLLTATTLPSFLGAVAAHAGTDLQYTEAAIRQLRKVTLGQPGAVIRAVALLAKSRTPDPEAGPVSKEDVVALNMIPVVPKVASSASVLRSPVAAPVLIVLALVGFGFIYQFLYQPEIVDNLHVGQADSSVEATTVTAASEESPLAERPLTDAPIVEDPVAEAPMTGAPVVEDSVADSDILPVPAEEAIEAAIAEWTDAWQSRDVDRYLGSYQQDFLPRGGGNRARWEEERRRNFGSKAWIALQVSELHIISMSENAAEISFWLKYDSPNYSDDTLKQLSLGFDGRNWLISNEINLEVVP